MRSKELTPQIKWNHKHHKCLRESSKRYYIKNRNKILRKLKIRYAKKKMKSVNK